MKKIVKDLEKLSDELSNQSCTFWACKGTPKNNRIESMITCVNCQTVIEINRAIRKLKKIKFNNENR